MSDRDEIGLSPEIKFHLVRKIETHKVIGLQGLSLLAHEQRYLEFHKVAGVILFERNVESLSQLRSLIESVGALQPEGAPPPLVMADHEGDFVSELKRLIGVPPSPMAIAATGESGLAREVAYETGRAMKKLGVNVVLSPVADCFREPTSAVTGIRTFAKDPYRVGEFVSETIQGFKSAGILTCVKHFPGHGSTAEDSHAVLPVVVRTLDELRNVDLVPFARAVRDGVDLVMMSHIAFPSEEKESEHVPASFDRRLIHDVLRTELGFEGVVITDALEMEGARTFARVRFGGITGGFERSILAGSDLLLYSDPVPEAIQTGKGAAPLMSLNVMEAIIRTLERVVDKDRIQRRLEEAAEKNEGVRNLLGILDGSEARVNHIRWRAGELQTPLKREANDNVIRLEDYPSAPSIYKTVAERALVLLRDPAAFIPVDDKAKCLLVPVEYRPGESLKRQDIDEFTAVLCRHFPSWTHTPPVVRFEKETSNTVRPVFAAPGVQDAARVGRGSNGGKALRLAEDTMLLPVFSSRGRPPEELLENLTEFVDGFGAPFVIVTGSPIIDWIPDSVGCLVTLGASAQVAAAVARVLSGDAKPGGSLNDVW